MVFELQFNLKDLKFLDCLLFVFSCFQHLTLCSLYKTLYQFVLFSCVSTRRPSKAENLWNLYYGLLKAEHLHGL